MWNNLAILYNSTDDSTWDCCYREMIPFLGRKQGSPKPPPPQMVIFLKQNKTIVT